MPTPFRDRPGFDPQAISTLHSGTSGEEGSPRYTLGNQDSDPPEVRPHDFTQPERISQDQLKSVASLHERFAREYASQLSGMSRVIVDIQIESAEQLSYEDYIGGLGETSACAIVKAPELGVHLVLEMSRGICFPLIERLLGGDVDAPVIPDRALTTIEHRMACSVLHRAMKPLHEAWSGLVAVDFTIDTVESNPQNARVISPNEVVLALRFRVGFPGGAGTMSLCLPCEMIEKRIEGLGSSPWAGGSQGPSQDGPAVQQFLGEASVEVSAVLGPTTITLAELRSMQPGDVVLTGVPTTDPATVCVEGCPKFQARQGQHSGRRAVQVVEIVPPGREGGG